MKKFLGLDGNEWKQVIKLILVIGATWIIGHLLAGMFPPESFMALGIQYVANGLLIILASVLATYFILNLAFPTIDRYLDAGLWGDDFANSKKEVRICIIAFVICALFLSCVLAFKP